MGCTFKLWLGRVLKVIDVFRDHFPIDYQVALLVYHVGDHEDLRTIKAVHNMDQCIQQNHIAHTD